MEECIYAVTTSHGVRFVSSEFEEELEKTWQQDRLTQNVLISNENQTGRCYELLWHFQGQCTQFTICQQTCDGSIPPLWRMRPLTIAITPLLLRLPSICVMSKRPYQCCWCRSRKCTSLLPISQDSGSSIRKHVLNYTLLYWYISNWYIIVCSERLLCVLAWRSISGWHILTFSLYIWPMYWSSSKTAGSYTSCIATNSVLLLDPPCLVSCHVQIIIWTVIMRFLTPTVSATWCKELHTCQQTVGRMAVNAPQLTSK